MYILSQYKRKIGARVTPALMRVNTHAVYCTEKQGKIARIPLALLSVYKRPLRASYRNRPRLSLSALYTFERSISGGSSERRPVCVCMGTRRYSYIHTHTHTPTQVVVYRYTYRVGERLDSPKVPAQSSRRSISPCTLIVLGLTQQQCRACCGQPAMTPSSSSSLLFLFTCRYIYYIYTRSLSFKLEARVAGTYSTATLPVAALVRVCYMLSVALN